MSEWNCSMLATTEPMRLLDGSLRFTARSPAMPWVEPSAELTLRPAMFSWIL